MINVLGMAARVVRRLRSGRAVAAPVWYVSQGNDPTECGAAVAAMALAWARADRRAVNTRFGIWYLPDIEQRLGQSGVAHFRANTHALDLTQLTDGQGVIVLIRVLGFVNHFVFVTCPVVDNPDGELLVCDPLSGVRLQSPEQLRGEMVAGSVLVVTR